MTYSKAVLLFLSLSFTLTVHADILGVEDAALIKQAFEQLEALKTQLSLMQQTYDTAKSQLASIESLKNANIGHYGMGALYNGDNALRALQSSASTWDEALKNISGGNPERYNELVKAYEENHHYLSDASYQKTASPARFNQYRQNKAVNEAVSVQTTYVFNDINERLKTIHALSAQIDKTPNTKSALDLNTRLITELAYIEVMNLKLQTLMSQQIAQNSASDLEDDNEMMRFNRLPSEDAP